MYLKEHYLGYKVHVLCIRGSPVSLYLAISVNVLFLWKSDISQYFEGKTEIELGMDAHMFDIS